MSTSELYKESEWCMEFTNQEILDYFVSAFKNNPNVYLRILSDDEEFAEGTDKK